MEENKEVQSQNVGCIIAVIGAIIASIGVSLMTGCVNLYTRCPGTNARIEDVYQSSRGAAALSVVGAFPQMMSDNPSTSGSGCWENLISIPFIGLPFAVDAVCEACIDTVCLPVDWPLAELRKEGD